MGLTARDWLTIALFLFTTMAAWAGFLLRRFLRTVDRHQDALYGEHGLFRQLSLYVKREDHDMANAELAAHMEKMRLEGIQREGRIIDAIQDSARQSTTENQILRTDLGKMGDRIDRVQDRLLTGHRRQ